MRLEYLDREKVLRLLTKRAERLLAEDPRVERVALFGSLVKGNYLPGSDADILIVLKESDEPHWFRRTARYIDYFLTREIPVELFPYTTDELARMQSSGNMFVKEMLKTTIDLASRPKK